MHILKRLDNTTLETQNDDAENWIDQSRKSSSCTAEIKVQEKLSRNGIVLVSRDQIEVGKLLGRGAFANVYNVSKFHDDSKESRKNGSWYRVTRGGSRKQIIPYKEDSSSSSHNYDVQQERHYAIKVLDKFFWGKTEAELKAARGHLMMEVKCLLRCHNHPYILQVRGLPEDGTAAWGQNGCIENFFVMTDKLDDTLNKRIRRWREDRSSDCVNTKGELIMKVQYALQICSALQFLHQQRLIFRDLKPRNIGFIANPKKRVNRDHEVGHFSCSDERLFGNMHDRIQIFDFGCCRELPAPCEDRKRPRTDFFDKYPEKYVVDDGNRNFYKFPQISGCPRYVAGEIPWTGGFCNLKSDVYSFGLIFYEMLGHEKVFDSYPMKRMKEEVWLKGIRPSLTKSARLAALPKSISRLVERSWSKYPSQRPTSAHCCAVLEVILEKLMDAELSKNKKVL